MSHLGMIKLILEVYNFLYCADTLFLYLMRHFFVILKLKFSKVSFLMLTVFPWGTNCAKRIVMTILKYIHENIKVRCIVNRLYNGYEIV